MDFQSAMETFAEAWMAANTKIRPELNETQQVFTRNKASFSTITKVISYPSL